MRWVFAVFFIALTACKSHGPPRSGARGALAIVRVDDSTDPFDAIATGTLPPGITIESETAALGPGKTASTHFARIEATDATKAAAVTRMRTWLGTLSAPPSTRFALGDVRDARTFALSALRTYVLGGTPVETSTDITEAEARNADGEWTVRITFTRDGGRRLEQLTHDWMNRRIAITLDDEVQSAPVIRSFIEGGQVSITMGADATDARKRAENLAASLRP